MLKGCYKTCNKSQDTPVPSLMSLFLFYETESFYVARFALNLQQSSCISLLNAGIIGTYYYRFIPVLVGSITHNFGCQSLERVDFQILKINWFRRRRKDLKLIYFVMSSCLCCLHSILTWHVHRYTGALECEVTFQLRRVKKCVPSIHLNPERLEQTVLAPILPHLKFCIQANSASELFGQRWISFALCSIQWRILSKIFSPKTWLLRYLWWI